MFDACLLLSQISDPISGGAGWVGAGLLGLVLGWLLLKHLPEKDRQAERMMEGRDAVAKDLSAAFALQIREMSVMFAEQLKETRGEFKEALHLVMSHHEKQMTAMADAINKQIERLSGVTK